MLDWLLYNLLRFFMLLARVVPLEVSLVLARGLGWVYYGLAGRRNRTADANMRRAFPGQSFSWRQRVLRAMYGRYAQNAVEALYASCLKTFFLERHIRVANIDAVRALLKEKRPVIFLGCHAGSWELSNIATAVFFRPAPYAMLAQPQSRTPRLDRFLNRIREARGCRVIRTSELKKMVEHLSGGGMLGIVADHGGKDGVPVSFFGHLAMTPTGSIKLARKMKAQIVLAFMRRVAGPTHEMIFEPFALRDAADPQEDFRVNLEAMNRVFEGWITRYPEEYLWTYKRWKHSPRKNVLIISDGKAGHLKQSEALVGVLRGLGTDVACEVVDARFRGPWAAPLLAVLTRILGPGWAARFLPGFVCRETLERLLSGVRDAVVSAGSSVAALNLILSDRDGARSVGIMKPGIMSWSSFDLLVMPRHDRPPARSNVVVVPGALSDVTEATMARDFQALATSRPAVKEELFFDGVSIGLLVGGDSRHSVLPVEAVSLLVRQLEAFLDVSGAHLLATTSRRTSPEVAAVLRDRFSRDPRCKLLVVAAEENPAGTIGGIFHVSDILVVTGESISMVSEAIASGKPVIVLEPRYKSAARKNRRFLESCAEGRFIRRVAFDGIGAALQNVWREGLSGVPQSPAPDLARALKKLW